MPFHALMFEIHIVFSSSVLIRVNKDAYEGHLCQTVNNFVKQNLSSLLSPLRKRLDIIYTSALNYIIIIMILAIF